MTRERAYFPSIAAALGLPFPLRRGDYQPTIWRRVVPIAGMHVNDGGGENGSSFAAPKMPPRSVLFHRCVRDLASERHQDPSVRHL